MIGVVVFDDIFGIVILVIVVFLVVGGILEIGFIV